jgi:hypothetical protein
MGPESRGIDMNRDPIHAVLLLPEIQQTNIDKIIEETLYRRREGGHEEK